MNAMEAQPMPDEPMDGALAESMPVPEGQVEGMSTEDAPMSEVTGDAVAESEPMDGTPLESATTEDDPMPEVPAEDAMAESMATEDEPVPEESAEDVATQDEPEPDAVAMSDQGLEWYAVHAYSNYEDKVRTQLQERIERFGKQAEFGRIEVPTETSLELRDGQQKLVRRKTFPGYVLVQMKWSNENWFLVRDTPKVLGFIGADKQNQEPPPPIPDSQVEAILARAEEGQAAPRIKVMFEPGQIVRVIDGPFNDFNGVVEEANHEKGRLRVAIQIFGRSTPVDLAFDQVTKD